MAPAGPLLHRGIQRALVPRAGREHRQPCRGQGGAIEVTMTNDSEYFRAGVGAMIVDSSSTRVLVLRRADVTEREAWQMPQGGIKAGESACQALVREVAEEVGLEEDQYEIVRECAAWLAYELPEAYRSVKTGRGQVQKWFLLRIGADGTRIEPDQVEFDRSRWVPLDELIVLAAPFRASIYRKLVDWARAPSPPGSA